MSMNSILFPFSYCFVAQTQYEDHDKYKDELITYIKKYDKENKVDSSDIIASQIKHNVAESRRELDFLVQATISPVPHLVAFLENAITELYFELWRQRRNKDKITNGKANITESWYHITKTGGYHDQHTHTMSSFSGIYFIDVNECGPKNGCIRFWKPYDTTSPDGDIGLHWADNDLIDHQPINGQVIIFPGFLPHSAIPYYGKSDRIVIGFNAAIRPC